MASAGTIIGILWLAFWAYWLVSAFGVKKTIRDLNYWSYHIGSRMVAIGLIIVFFEVPGFRKFFTEGYVLAPSPAVHGAGILICAVGLGFAFWARLNLGKNWGLPGMSKENQELVTSGPYHFVRHPIYSGIFVAILGSSLVGGRMWLFALIACMPVLIYSAVREEKLIALAFPEQYSEYRKRSKMLIPFVR